MCSPDMAGKINLPKGVFGSKGALAGSSSGGIASDGGAVRYMGMGPALRRAQGPELDVALGG